MYKRVLLKLSGEALSSKESTFNKEVLENLTLELKSLLSHGIQVAIVVGGGNVMRGKFAATVGLPRVEADKMGMLATIINALAIQGACMSANIPCVVQSALECNKVCDFADHNKAIEALNQGKIVVYGGGTGNPYFTTDSCAALRAAEINCDVILMAKNGVDGVYSADPDKDPTATKYDELTYTEILDKQLGVMDATAAAICNDSNIESVVFSMSDLHNITRVCTGERIGTIIRRG